MHNQTIKISVTLNSNKTKGSALIVALFVIVIMTLLGGAIMKMQATSSENIAQEVIGTRALAAARTGMQVQLQKLFPLGGSGFCPNNPLTYNLSSIQGLQQCQVIVSCDNYLTHNEIKYYRLQSIGECGSGDITADSKNIVKSSRTIQVEARSL